MTSLPARREYALIDRQSSIHGRERRSPCVSRFADEWILNELTSSCLFPAHKGKDSSLFWSLETPYLEPQIFVFLLFVFLMRNTVWRYVLFHIVLQKVYIKLETFASLYLFIVPFTD